MERTRGKEAILTGILPLIGLGTLALISTFGFSKAVKREAVHQQGCRCAYCNGGPEVHSHFEHHHLLPRSEGGRDILENDAVVGGDPVRDCHEVLDRAAIDKGLIFDPQTHNFIPVAALPPERFKNEKMREKTLRRFSIADAIGGTITFLSDEIVHKTKAQLKKERQQERRIKKEAKRHAKLERRAMRRMAE